MHKAGAESVAFPAAAKKAAGPEARAELQGGVEGWLNGLNMQAVWAKKGKKAFLQFFAPFSPQDDGLGAYKGSNKDHEAWFCYKLQ
jgi:hypothetical protein